MLEILFDSGRVSNRAMLQSVFARTPRGHAQSVAVRDLNRALETLRGQTLANIRLSAAAPSQQSLTIETDGCRVVMNFSRGGVTISNLELG